MDTKIFLDLEETIITDIDTLKVIDKNLKRVISFINNIKENGKLVSIETFTFAMYDEYDKYQVEEVVKMLKPELDVHVQFWFTKDLRKEFIKDTLFSVNDKEMLDFNAFANKTRVFEWYIRKYHRNSYSMLIDDTVEDKLSLYYDKSTNIDNMIRLKNVSSL